MRLFILFFCLFFTTSAFSATESVMLHQVETAPKIQSADKLPQLVKHLTQNLKKDEDKAYILLAWIVKNIDYDDYKKDQVEQKMSRHHSRTEIPESGDIVKTRLGVCSDIATLYKKMLEEADLKAVTIDGCTGEINPRTKKCKNGTPGHTWNAVWIDHQWELVDPTWAITGRQVSAMEDISKKRAYERELKNREKKSAHTYDIRSDRNMDKKWFMTDPKIMEEEHQPENEKWRLTNQKDRRNKNL